MPGSGTMTPVTGGVAAGLSLAQPIPYTLLSLPRYAKIMGITPLHFARGATPGLEPVIFPTGTCDSIWYKYDWQDNDKVSWTQLAYHILDAEREIASLIGYWPAPMWIVNEQHKYPSPGMREYYGGGHNTRGDMKGVNAQYGKIIEAGRRATTLVGTATTGGGSLAYTDEDGDGYFETATIMLATTLTDASEIKLYQAGELANPDWEIRPVRSKTISGGIVTIVLDAWLLIDPDLYEDYPTSDGIGAIDVSTTTNYVTSVDVYREYCDSTQASAQFLWESGCDICGGTGCDLCVYTEQDGCSQIRDKDAGILSPFPATYDSGWQAEAWTNTVEADIVRFWYRAGAVDQRYERGFATDPLSDFWAQVIAWLATARLERPLCGCSNVRAVADELRKELAFNTREGAYFYMNDIINSPFGTRKGEVMAWRRIKYFVKDKKVSYALI